MYRQKDADNAAKLVGSLPLNATMNSALTQRDSVMPNKLRTGVPSIITDLNKQSEEWQKYVICIKKYSRRY